MKKIVIILMFVTAAWRSGAGLIWYDGFDYSPDSNLGGQGTWVNSNSGDEVTVAAGNLSVGGLAAATGNMVTYGGAGVDPYVPFATQSAATWYSFVLKATDLGSLNTSGGYFAGLASGGSYAAPVWLRSDGSGGFQIGISKRRDSGAVWSSSYAVNSTMLLVGNYVFNPNAADDIANLWINPDSATFSGTAPLPALTTGATGADLSSLNRFYLRQDSASTTPSVLYLDELRIGQSWGDVTPVPEPATGGLIAGVFLFGLVALRSWRSRRRSAPDAR